MYSSIPSTLRSPKPKKSHKQHAIQSLPQTLRYGHCASNIGTTLYVFGGVTVTGVSAQLSYSVNYADYELIETKTAIAPLENCSMVEFDGRLVTFGGATSRTMTNAVYSYSPSFTSWSKLNTSNTPTPRAFHTACIHKDKMYVFGGLNNAGEKLHEFYVFDLHTNVWSMIDIKSGLKPSRRSHATLACVGDSLFLYGGRGLTGDYDDFWKFDINERVWSRIAMDNGPMARFGQAMTVFNEYIIIGGGVVNNVPDKRLYVYNTLLDTWKCTSELLQERFLFSLTVVGGYLIAIGGLDHRKEIRGDSDLVLLDHILDPLLPDAEEEEDKKEQSLEMVVLNRRINGLKSDIQNVQLEVLKTIRGHKQASFDAMERHKTHINTSIAEVQQNFSDMKLHVDSQEIEILNIIDKTVENAVEKEMLILREDQNVRYNILETKVDNFIDTFSNHIREMGMVLNGLDTEMEKIRGAQNIE
ncbi:hypothetical protein PCE1_000349 [Barthelona sp. PCE]